MLALATIVSLSIYAQSSDMVPYRTGNKWGYSTTAKEVKLSPKYDQVDWFSNGYAAVRVGNKWGYINEAGKMVIPAKFTVAKPFRKGYMPKPNSAGGDTILYAGASVRSDGYEICINTKGATLKGCPAKNEDQENKEPIAVVDQKKTYSLPNSDGLYDQILDDYSANGETYYIVTKGGMYGVINSKLETVVPYSYQNISRSSAAGNTYLVVRRDAMYGMTDYAGKEVFPVTSTQLDVIDGLENKGYVIVKENGQSFVRNIDGTPMNTTGYGNIMYDKMGGFIITNDSNLKGYYFPNNTYISPKYTEITMMPGGRYLKVKTYSGEEGYISTNGDEYFVN